MTARATHASAIQIGNPVSIRKAIRALQRCDGLVEQASETQLAEAASRGDRSGMYNCPHTGVALAAVIKLAARGDISRGDRVVVLSTASALKFTGFKVASAGNEPIELPNDYDAVRHALDSLVPA